MLVSRKLPMQKLHLSNRLCIEQVTCHLLMLLLSARACSETAKQNSICFEICQIPVTWFALQIGRLLPLRCVKCEDFDWFLGGEFSFGCTVSPDIWSSCPWICGECALFFLFIYLFKKFFFRQGFSLRGGRWGFCILRGVISKHIIILFFFAVFEAALSRWNLLKVDIS